MEQLPNNDIINTKSSKTSVLSLLKDNLSSIKWNYKYTHDIKVVSQMLVYCFLGFKNKYLSNKPSPTKFNSLYKGILFNTPFGNYYCTTIGECKMMRDDYENEIGECIKDISVENIDSDKYFINIGCNIGRWAIDLAKNYRYHVIAFEPEETSYNHFLKNISLSELDNMIEPHNIGLGDKEGTVPFIIGDSCDTTAHVFNDNYTHKSKCMWNEIKKNIQIVQFDKLGIDKEMLEKTRLVIIDAEGFEYNILKGMEKTLKEFHNINIIIEIWEDQRQKQEILKFMNQLGYSSKQINEDNWLFTKG